MKRIGAEPEDLQLLMALIHFNNDPKLEAMRRWLAESLHEHEQQLAQQYDETRLRWQQGATQELRALQEQIADARDLLIRLRKQ